MSTIYFMRHGQDRDNARHILNGHRNEPLTPLGKKQVAVAARQLKTKKISLIYCSPLLRCRQTAAIVSKSLGVVSIIIEPLLIERDFGVLTGRPSSDIKKYAKKIIRAHGINYFIGVAKSEPFEKVHVRAKRVIKNLKQFSSDKNILIVAHNDIGKMLQAVVKNITPVQSLRTPYFHNAEVATLTKIRSYAKRPKN